MAGQSGPELIDRHGHPVWFVPVSRNVVANNLALQTYNGKPALSYWVGVENAAGVIKSGKDIVVNQQYKTVATLKGKNGWIVDLHEMVIDGKDAWVIASKSERKDLRPEHGPRHGTFVDNAVQEYDLTNGKLLYTWDAADHVKLGDTFIKFIRNGVWDPYHMNSLQLTGSKTFLVSLRNTWAAYQIDMSTGKADWTLGGKHSTFRFKGKAQFQWQHDVQLHRNNVVSVFDDHCCKVNSKGQLLVPNGPTRGLVLKLNMGKKTATMTKQYTRGKHFYAAFLGDTDLLSNGGAVIGWGSSQPFFSEYGRSGSCCSTSNCRPTRPDISRDARSLDRHAEQASGRSGEDQGRPRHRVRELEWRHRSVQVAGAGQQRQQAPFGCGHSWQRRVRDEDRPVEEVHELRGRRARPQGQDDARLQGVPAHVRELLEGWSRPSLRALGARSWSEVVRRVHPAGTALRCSEAGAPASERRDGYAGVAAPAGSLDPQSPANPDRPRQSPANPARRGTPATGRQ